MAPFRVTTLTEQRGYVPKEMVRGWVSQPNGRGTIDILQSSLLTILLCGWSVLFLNVPPERKGPFGFLAHKSRWMLFTMFFPEMMTGIAAEQWRSASQSVEDFYRLKEQWELALKNPQCPQDDSRIKENLSRLGSAPWTMRHAFFADMGGLHLVCPNFTPFPIDAQQVFYLVQNDHLDYPDVSAKMIWDKNKADGFARALTLVQITWFFIECAGRFGQHLAISTLELSTLAFIFCTVNTLFFWRHKPLDVDTPIYLPCATTMEEILNTAGDQSRKRYEQTPLDFVKPAVVKKSLIAPFWFGMSICFDWRERGSLPVKTFGNSTTTPPRGLKPADVVYGIIYTTSYFGIHLAGWNFAFSSSTEQKLWRIASLTALGLAVFYLLAVAIGTAAAGSIAKSVFKNDEVENIIGLGRLLPRWKAVLLHGPVIVAYGLARAYIIVEGFASLRALPPTAFASVDWSNYLPHFN